MKRIQESGRNKSPSEKRQRFLAARIAESGDRKDMSKPYFETTYQEQGSLCSRCSSINPDDLFLDLENKERGKRLMNLGKLGAEAELSSCLLCHLFNAVKIQSNDDPDTDDYILYATSAPSPNSLNSGLVLAVARGVDKGRLTTSWVSNIHAMGKSRGFIATSSAPSQLGPHANSLRARSINAKSIDFGIIRGWVRFCNTRHTKQCLNDAILASRPKKLKLIDCEQRRIIPAPPSYKYSALSYVWGENISCVNEQPVDDRLPVSLPQTIEDALKVTIELGLRYIWIDRYCIDQNEDADKQMQIQQMDVIYQNAFITIIAAAGTDPHFGLPGVGPTSRTFQPTAWVGGRCLVSIFPDPQQLIKDSKWIKRAWTYQEGFFSSRRLVFTEQQVYFECKAGTSYEMVEDFNDSIYFHLFNSASYYEQRPWGISYHLSAYSGRELSIEADVIRAFEGIFHSFRSKKFPVFQYLGVPIMPCAIGGRNGGIKPSNRIRSEAFAAGLSWLNTAPGTRRIQFPSWSWAGWTAPIDSRWPSLQNGLKLENERRLRIFIENQDGSLLDVIECDDASLDQGLIDSSGKYIHIEAWTISIDIQYMPEGTKHWIDNFRSTTGWSHNISGYFAIFSDDKMNLQVPLYSLYQTYDNDTEQQSFAPNFSQEELLGIILGRCENVADLQAGEDIFVMIVQNKGQYFERVGCMKFMHAMLRVIPDNTNGRYSNWTPWELCFRQKERRTLRVR